MTPLRAFLKIAKALAKSPMHFWSADGQKALLKETDSAAIRLKKILEGKDLKDTQAYKHLDVLEKSVTEKDIDELAFVQALANLVEINNPAAEPRGMTRCFATTLFWKPRVSRPSSKDPAASRGETRYADCTILAFDKLTLCMI